MQDTNVNNLTFKKALDINLNPDIYGTIAEIGAGQEVARIFFQAGGASGTIAKTMSAYDMLVSDAIYGEEKDGRYVSQARLKKMLDREFNLVVERLLNARPASSTFFAFADTVAAKGYQSKGDCHGWMGIKYQAFPGAQANEIILHVRMKDTSNAQQQLALGILGVNLIFSAFYYFNQPERLIESLIEDVGAERIEIDMIMFTGPEYLSTDNRLMAIHLVKSGLCPSVFFNSNKGPVQPSELFHKKNILLLRGSFRPVKNIHVDIIQSGMKEMLKNTAVAEVDLVFLAEISLAKLFNDGEIDKQDFLGRVDTLCKLGYNVQISNFTRYFKLKEYLRQFTNLKIAIVLGVRKLELVFSEEGYHDLSGGILEALGILFAGDTRVYVYPKLDENGTEIQLGGLFVNEKRKYLFQHFVFSEKIIPLREFNAEILKIDTSKLAENLRNGNPAWKNLVPKAIHHVIINRGLFDYCSTTKK